MDFNFDFDILVNVIFIKDEQNDIVYIYRNKQIIITTKINLFRHHVPYVIQFYILLA